MAGSVILVFDAHYSAAGSGLAAGAMRGWEAGVGDVVVRRWRAGPAADYVPGQFYRRELPLILHALADYGLAAPRLPGCRALPPLPDPAPLLQPADIEAIVIDGYVRLGEDKRPGLGGYLYAALDGTIPVVGVAKTYFRGTAAVPVLRGASKRPLFVTAAGYDAERAAERVRRMAGDFRIPETLKVVDTAARSCLDES